MNFKFSELLCFGRKKQLSSTKEALLLISSILEKFELFLVMNLFFVMLNLVFPLIVAKNRSGVDFPNGSE